MVGKEAMMRTEVKLWCWAGVALTAALLALWVAPARAEKPARLAIVIGNGAYESAHLPRLPNPTNDATDIARTLRGLGFETTLHLDLSTRDMVAQLRRFRAALRKKRVEIAAVFFAGHAIQSQGESYLFGVDADPRALSDLRRDAVSVSELMSHLRGVAGLRLVILDACRDSGMVSYLAGGEPRLARSAGLERGLARFPKAAETRDALIAYATAAGKTAEDGRARNSPYTAALLKILPTPGIEIDEAFRRVRSAVLTATRRSQAPDHQSQRGARNYYLAGAATSAPLAEPAAPPPAPRPDAGATFEARLRAAGRAGATECAGCPEMVAIAGGAYLMGAPKTETLKRRREEPQHRVRLKSFAIGRTEITVGQYRRFVAATKRKTGPGCWIVVDGSHRESPTATWDSPGFAQTDAHPVTCISWRDAQAYAAWLSRSTGAQYRLPTEAEWEYAARAGTTTRYPWGHPAPAGCPYANVSDETAHARYSKWIFLDCADGFAHTGPVASLKPNGWGLFDMIGNVNEWVADCAHSSHKGAPTDGGARLGGCDRPKAAIIRGGGWTSFPGNIRSAWRAGLARTSKSSSVGFRVARSLLE
ncbi:MAG: SUMF1/EgtB/PvdO family nonheme iron enzyme [Neomegalonema sp.]|nr:SUMF1/EgtB/PvdO family nonheme iron enzyme [Neomegalonema sp.]